MLEILRKNESTGEENTKGKKITLSIENKVFRKRNKDEIEIEEAKLINRTK